LSPLYFLETLLAFNIGVELGQLTAVVAVALPVLLLARRPETKQKVLRYGSVTLLLLASVWLVQRMT